MASTAAPIHLPTLVNGFEMKPAQDKPNSSSLSAWCCSNWKPILAELVSTCTLVLFGCMSCIPIDWLTQQSPLYAPLGFGLTVMFNIHIFGHISMAHMNPAVTLAGVIWGNTSIPLAICYMFVQVLGAAGAYGILIGLAPIDLTENGICLTLLHRNVTEVQGLFIEIILTGTLSMLCCRSWDPVGQLDSAPDHSTPIKFGLAVIGLSVIGGPLTGASMNPARSFGPALWNGRWDSHWLFWVGPFVGAALATIFYKVVFLNKNKHV